MPTSLFDIGSGSARSMGRRRNGFSCPWHPAQMSGWLAFLAIVAAFVVMVTLVQSTDNGVLVLSVLYLIAAVVLWSAAAYVQAVDPSDPGCLDSPRSIRTATRLTSPPADVDRGASASPAADGFGSMQLWWGLVELMPAVACSAQPYQIGPRTRPTQVQPV